MPEPVLEQTVTDSLREILPSVTEPLVVTASGNMVAELVAVLDDLKEPSVRLLAPEGVLKDVLADFLVARVAADLVAADRLEIRTGAPASTELVVGDDAVVALVTAGDRVAGLATDDEAFVASATDHYAGLWTAADPFTLRTPARSRIQQTLDAEFGPDIAADFERVLVALETARGDGEGLNEVTISLLVAARHEELLYDISRWGEEIGLASKATFSRTKTQLEERGLIETEKVPIEVGRPRQRLLLGDDRLREASPADLATTAQSLIATAPQPASQ